MDTIYQLGKFEKIKVLEPQFLSFVPLAQLKDDPIHTTMAGGMLQVI